MQYKVISKGVKYKVMKSALAYKPLIYKAVIIVLTIKMPDGSVLANKHVTINGNTYMTNASGRVSITDDMGLSVTYRVKYNDLYYTDISVTYTANASYNVTLEQHVAAGSVTISEWAFSSTSSYAKKAVYVGRSAGCNRCQDDRQETQLWHKSKSRLRRY